MRKMIGSLLFLALTIPVFPQMMVDDIVLNQGRDWPSGKAPTVRVNLHNPGTEKVSPGTVELQIRPDGKGYWHTIKVWKTDSSVAAGQRLTLGFRPATEGSLDPLLATDHFELQAVVNGVSGPQMTYQRRDSATR